MSPKKPKYKMLFIYAMWWRIVYGTTRTILGLYLLSAVNEPLNQVLQPIFGNAFTESSPGTVMYYFATLLQTHPLVITTFVAWYVIFWGVMDTGLSIAMLRKYVLAFPISLTLIAVFTTIEIIRAFYIQEYYWLLLCIIDAVIWLLIFREFRSEKILASKRKTETAP